MGINTYKDVNKDININKNNTEHFNQEKIKNTCHYVCSSINYTNIVILVIFIILVYHMIISNFKFTN
jgi:hypothetical protein